MGPGGLVNIDFECT